MNNREINFLKKNTVSETKKLIEEISKYNTADFIMNVSALILFPQNQSKAVIFQSMINAALTIPIEKSNLDNKMSITTFKNIVSKFEKTSASLMVDPPEFPFILPVVYFNNPHVFMGNNTLSPIYLSNILKAFEISKGKLDKFKYNDLRKRIHGLLSLSEEIKKKIGVDLSDLKSYSVENSIFVPDKNTLDRYKSFLTIKSSDFKKIFEDKENEYTIEFASLNEYDILNIGNPDFVFKPFIKIGSSYGIIDVTCILPLVYRMVIKDTYGISDLNVVGEYNNISSIELRKRFMIMGLHELTPNGLDLIKDNDYEENIFLLGNDRVIISAQLFDVGDKFNFNDNESTIIFSREGNFIYERIKYISEFLVSHGVDKKNIFPIITPYTLGRTFMYSLNGYEQNDVLILSLYEIYAISVNEENNKYFLQEYIDSRKRLKQYHLNSFSELNLISLFTINDNSFYSSDEVDVKEVFLGIIGEYSSDYILKSYLRESKMLCNSYKRNTLIEVIKIDDCVYFAPQLFLEKILNKVIIDNESTTWIVCNGNTIDEYNLFQWLSDLITYWLSELMPFKSNNYNLIIKLVIDENLKDGIKQLNISDDISSIIKYKIDNNIIEIYVTEELCNYFNSDDNAREKRFIEYLLEIMGHNYGIIYDKVQFNKLFSNPYRKKTISIDSINGAHMIPSNSNEHNQVSRALENMILDDIGGYLKNEKKCDYGVINDDKVLVNVVDYLYKRLLHDLKEYSKHDLLCYLYEMYDNNLGNLLIRQHYYAFDVACHLKHKKDIDNNLNEMTKLSVALRFLIELVSSFDDSGSKVISFYDINRDIAISSQIIEWAYADDLLHYDMISSDITLLDSNRIGFDKTAANRINVLMRKAMLIKNSERGIEKSKRLGIYLPKVEDDSECFKKAFAEEFDYSYDDYTETTLTILEMFGDNYDYLIKIKIEDVMNNLQRKISEEIIRKILDSLSLEERNNFLKPTSPYVPEDVYPWRFNRGLSLTRKPFVKINNEYFVGYRTLINSVHFLLSLINEGKLKSKTQLMKDYESTRNNVKGKRFNDQVYNYLLSFNSLIVKKNLKKVNRKFISDENNNTLGDIDVLYISIKKRIIGVIETKNFNMSKNYYEIQNEYKEMFDQNNSKCFYNKHKKRVDWVKEHINDFIEEFNLPKGKWKIRDMFIVDDYILSKKTYNVDVNIHVLRDLDEKILLK